jgi:hypothetical protein
LLSSLNVSGFATLMNTTTLLSSLNVSGFTTLNNNVSLLSSLNGTGQKNDLARAAPRVVLSGCLLLLKMSDLI